MYNSTQQQVFMMMAGVEFYVLSLATQQFLHVMIPEYNDMIYDKQQILDLTKQTVYLPNSLFVTNLKIHTGIIPERILLQLCQIRFLKLCPATAK